MKSEAETKIELGFEMNRRIMRKLQLVYAKLELVVGEENLLKIDRDR